MKNCLLLIAGGALGTVSRYYLTMAAHSVWATRFPVGTLLVNILGCFLIGLLGTLHQVREVLSPEARLLLVTGFCGAFTTFSTFVHDSAGHIQVSESHLAFCNIFISLAAGYAFYRLGEMAARSF